MPNRQDNVRITAEVDGVGDLGTFEDRAGGASDSAAVTYQLGGMGGRVALGGAKEVTNVTIKRIYDDKARTYVSKLRGLTGRGRMTIKEVPLDDEGVAIDTAMEVFRGILKSVHVADRKSDAAAAAEIDLEMVVDGPVGV